VDDTSPAAVPLDPLSDQAAALRPAGTLRGRTAEHLANLILSGVFPAGEYLPPEDELTRRLGISRTAYREAICRLEAQGLVEVRHGVGTLVIDRSREAVADSLLLLLRRRSSATADLLEARQILETETAALAAQRATAEELQALDTALDAMRRPGTTPDEYTAGDLRFHLTLALASHNEVLAALAESLRGALHDAIAATFAVDGRTERRLRDHERILQAVRARDPVAACQAMAMHLEATRAALQQLGRLSPGAPRERAP
jgi:GntR family transcriptional repressor for pyruvate dehydrogenase complex